MCFVFAFSLTTFHLKLLLQFVYVLFDTSDEMVLVLANGATNTRSYEQGVVSREDLKHLVSAARSAKLIAKLGRNTLLHYIDALLVAESVDLY